MSKIVAWTVTVTWDDGTTHDVSSYLPMGTVSAVEQFCDYWEEVNGDEENTDDCE